MSEQGTTGQGTTGQGPTGQGPSGADLPDWVRDALRCPRCGAALREWEATSERSADPAFVCLGFEAHRYPVADGIVRLIDESR